MDVQSVDKLLHRLYYDEYNFDSAQVLHKKAARINPNITYGEVRRWLKKQAAHQVHTVKIKKLKAFQPIYSEAPNAFQMDLTFFPSYQRQNSGYTVLFTAIGVNNRRAYAYTLRSKDANELLRAFKEFHKDVGKITTLTCDEGREFNNYLFKNYCTQHDITVFFVLRDSYKLGIINRFHRTLKEKLSRYMTVKATTRWIDVIDKIVENYNNTPHRGLHGLTPNEMDIVEEAILVVEKRNRLGKKKFNRADDRYEVGDKVRLRREFAKFEKRSMKSRFSSEVYTVTKVGKNSLSIRDADGNEKHNVKPLDVVKVEWLEEGTSLTEVDNLIKKEENDDRRERKVNRALKELEINMSHAKLEGKRKHKKLNLD